MIKNLVNGVLGMFKTKTLTIGNNNQTTINGSVVGGGLHVYSNKNQVIINGEVICE